MAFVVPVAQTVTFLNPGTQNYGFPLILTASTSSAAGLQRCRSVRAGRPTA